MRLFVAMLICVVSLIGILALVVLVVLNANETIARETADASEKRFEALLEAWKTLPTDKGRGVSIVVFDDFETAGPRRIAGMNAGRALWRSFNKRLGVVQEPQITSRPDYVADYRAPTLMWPEDRKLVLSRAALLALTAFMLGPALADAQTPAQLPGEPATAVELPAEPREPLAARGRFQPPAARAIELAFGATTWTLVQVSTNGAASDLSRYAAQGFYKRELIELVLMSAAATHSLARSVEDRKKGAKLSQLALNYNLDYAKIVERALAVEEQVDRTYLPLFPERRPRREREE